MAMQVRRATATQAHLINHTLLTVHHTRKQMTLEHL